MWHSDRFFSEFFGFPLSISFYPGFPSWGMNNRLVGGRTFEKIDLKHSFPDPSYVMLNANNLL
jgi:hypothetical protein